jgi:GAF domain-containing protein
MSRRHSAVPSKEEPIALQQATIIAAAAPVLASQANHTTEHLLAQRERQQASAARLGSKALSGMELDDLLDLAVDAVGATLDVQHVGLAQLQPDGTFSFHAGIGWKPGLVGKAGLPTGSHGDYVLSAREPVVFSDLATETRFEGATILREAGIVSGMTVPIPGGDRPWGILGVHSTVPRTFSRDDVNFLEAVAQILANAIGRKRTEAALAARVRQQAAVARLGHEALVRELPELLSLAAHEVAGTLQADFCKVLEVDRDGLLLILRAGVGWHAGSVGNATVPADTHSQAGFALGSDRAVIVDDLATETRFEPAPLLLEHGVVSGMSVIIRGRDGPYGVLGVHSRQRRHFSEDDIAFLETAAALLGAAVERFRVHEELRRHRSHLEEEVGERTRQLAASNKELEAFSYSVSHDLRAPLRTISGYSTLLVAKHGERLGGEAIELLDGVRKNAERLGRLIDDLLDLSRVQRVDLVRDRVDLSALAQRTLANLAAGEPGRKVACSVQPGLEAQGDGRLLGILMENLLANAWKFTRRTPDAAIMFGRQGSNGGPIYFVKDNGAGLDMAYASKLFQPFQRLHRPSEFEGTGIGLATVKRIIERHGGRVWMEGRPGAGATVYFTLGSGKSSS